MTRLAPFVLGVLLSGLVHSVEAKSKSGQVRVYQFTSDECSGHPKGSNVDVKRDDCVSVDGRSFRPRVDKKRAGWVDQVNNSGDLQCGLYLYTQPQCYEDDLWDVMALPAEIDQCFTSPTGYAVRSVKFVCSEFQVGYNV
jgi:hypothetical protein